MLRGDGRLTGSVPIGLRCRASRSPRPWP